MKMLCGGNLTGHFPCYYFRIKLALRKNVFNNVYVCSKSYRLYNTLEDMQQKTHSLGYGFKIMYKKEDLFGNYQKLPFLNNVCCQDLKYSMYSFLLTNFTITFIWDHLVMFKDYSCLCKQELLLQ